MNSDVTDDRCSDLELGPANRAPLFPCACACACICICRGKSSRCDMLRLRVRMAGAGPGRFAGYACARTDARGDRDWFCKSILRHMGNVSIQFGFTELSRHKAQSSLAKRHALHHFHRAGTPLGQMCGTRRITKQRVRTYRCAAALPTALDLDDMPVPVPRLGTPLRGG